MVLQVVTKCFYVLSFSSQVTRTEFLICCMGNYVCIMC